MRPHVRLAYRDIISHGDDVWVNLLRRQTQYSYTKTEFYNELVEIKTSQKFISRTLVKTLGPKVLNEELMMESSETIRPQQYANYLTTK